MNRLWVWISVVIVGVILIVALFPFAYRFLFPAPKLPDNDNDHQQLETPDRAAFRLEIERRFWINLSRTLAVGAVAGLIAGILLTRWLVAPLRRLEQGASALANRQFDYRTPVLGSVEMRSVATSFNEMAAELQRQESLRRNMLADVTHELRHPVHILQGNLQAILDGVYPLEMEEIARLLDHTQGLATLVDDLHELAQAEARQLALFKSETLLNRLVQNTAEAFQPLYGEKGVALTVELPDEEVMLNIDAGRIQQAVQNLLGNALRYTPQGGQVTAALTTQTDRVCITVQDSGIGMTAADLSRVFDRFYRSDAARSRHAPGTGLGLAIAQAILRAHDGGIDATSAGPGEGSTFTMWMPRK